MGQPAPSVGKEPPLYLLAGIGAIFAGLTLVTPFAFQAGGDNAFIALAIPASLLTLMATRVAERTPTKRALWLIFGIGILLRIYVLLFDPLLSSDIFRYIWDGRVQAAGINPYRYFPAHDAVAHLRDADDLSQDQSGRLCRHDLSAGCRILLSDRHAHRRKRKRHASGPARLRGRDRHVGHAVLASHGTANNPGGFIFLAPPSDLGDCQ